MKPPQVAELHDTVSREVGAPDILMNAAGVAVVGCAEEIPLETWDSVIGVNLLDISTSSITSCPTWFARGAATW